MKLRLQVTGALLAIIPVTGFAQQIPNGDMETWVAIGTSAKEKPEGWDTPDVLGEVLFGLPESDVVDKKSTDAHSGTFSAELTTKELTLPLIGPLTIPGTLALGTIVFQTMPTISAGVVGGYPMSEAPDSFLGFYKYSPAAGDSMNIAVIAKKDGVQIGGGQMKDPTTVTEWTAFNVPITYAGGMTPDTIQIIISSSGGFSSAVPGSVLKVDGMAFTGLVSADDIADADVDMDVYPNPASDVITMVNPLQSNATLEIFSLTGEKLNEVNMTSGSNVINVEAYASGIYLYRLNDNGNYVSAGKFQVAR